MFDEEVSTGNGGMFLKLESGESVTGFFRGDVNTFFQIWNNQEKKSELAEKGDPGAKFRFKVNFVVHENGDLIPKIFEGGATVYAALKDLEDSGYEMNKTAVILKRSGKGLDTRWSVTPSPKVKVDKKLSGLLESVELNALEPQEKTDGDIPF